MQHCAHACAPAIQGPFFTPTIRWELGGSRKLLRLPHLFRGNVRSIVSVATASPDLIQNAPTRIQSAQRTFITKICHQNLYFRSEHLSWQFEIQLTSRMHIYMWTPALGAATYRYAVRHCGWNKHGIHLQSNRPHLISDFFVALQHRSSRFVSVRTPHFRSICVHTSAAYSCELATGGTLNQLLINVVLKCSTGFSSLATTAITELS